jgi:hypothetical protein
MYLNGTFHVDKQFKCITKEEVPLFARDGINVFEKLSNQRFNALLKHIQVCDLCLDAVRQYKIKYGIYPYTERQLARSVITADSENAVTQGKEEEDLLLELSEGEIPEDVKSKDNE